MAVFCSSPDTFVVEEVAAYLPSGSGDHTFLWMEKRNLTTPEAVRRLAHALGIAERDIGYAGMKDRHATTRQWISVPRVDPAVALTLAQDDLRILRADRHGNKLRVGHLRGNRFEVVLTEVEPAEIEVFAGRLATLRQSGLPNRFGRQRFGAASDNVQTGLDLLRGRRRERDTRKRRLFLSALQSAVFNRVLDLRAESGGLCRVRQGDLLQKTDTGGLFVTDDPGRDQPRVDAGEVVPTAPLPGNRVLEAPEGSEARALEDRAMAEVGLGKEDLAKAGRELPGTRRQVVVAISFEDPLIVVEPEARVRLRFALQAGSYATVLLEALAACRPALSPSWPVPTRADLNEAPSGQSPHAERKAVLSFRPSAKD